MLSSCRFKEIQVSSMFTRCPTTTFPTRMIPHQDTTATRLFKYCRALQEGEPRQSILPPKGISKQVFSKILLLRSCRCIWRRRAFGQSRLSWIRFLNGAAKHGSYGSLVITKVRWAQSAETM